MGNSIVTEADRKATPAPKPPSGMSSRTGGHGQRVSLERGVATRSKKNPGKRAKKGGSAVAVIVIGRWAMVIECVTGVAAS